MAALKIHDLWQAQVFHNFNCSVSTALYTYPVHALIHLMADLYGSLRPSEENSSQTVSNSQRSLQGANNQDQLKLFTQWHTQISLADQKGAIMMHAPSRSIFFQFHSVSGKTMAKITGWCTSPFWIAITTRWRIHQYSNLLIQERQKMSHLKG